MSCVLLVCLDFQIPLICYAGSVDETSIGHMSLACGSLCTYVQSEQGELCREGGGIGVNLDPVMVT